MLFDSHGIGGGGQGGQGEGVDMHPEHGNQDWEEEGVQDGNRSRQMFLFNPIYPDSSGDCSCSEHGVDGGVWSW